MEWAKNMVYKKLGWTLRLSDVDRRRSVSAPCINSVEHLSKEQCVDSNKINNSKHVDVRSNVPNSYNEVQMVSFENAGKRPIENL